MSIKDKFIKFKYGDEPNRCSHYGLPENKKSSDMYSNFVDERCVLPKNHKGKHLYSVYDLDKSASQEHLAPNERRILGKRY